MKVPTMTNRLLAPLDSFACMLNNLCASVSHLLIDNLCKQFGPRSRSKLFIVFLKRSWFWKEKSRGNTEAYRNTQHRVTSFPDSRKWLDTDKMSHSARLGILHIYTYTCALSTPGRFTWYKCRCNIMTGLSHNFVFHRNLIVTTHTFNDICFPSSCKDFISPLFSAY